MNLWIGLTIIGIILYLLVSPLLGTLFVVVGLVLIVATALGAI